MSPRRSSRARNTVPPPVAVATNSSASSISSGRTRSHHKVASPQTSNPRSQSLDDAEDTKLAPRRTRSGLEELKQPPPKDEPEEDEEEVTRCVCGQMEYPGLPSPLQEDIKHAFKLNGTTSSDEGGGDDVSGIFIQCDICKVWQHGGCVGILDDDSAPEEYFCEECRKDLHSVSTTSSGQRYSRYKPVQEEPSPPNSPPPSSRETRKAKDSKPRASAEALLVKRRPTMNSYDEQEQLRRAIEESKKENIVEADKKRVKRSHDDSEADGSPNKRQRTGSHSEDPEKSNAISSSDEALADARPERRNGRETRHRDKDQKERDHDRQDDTAAASKRKSRTDKRRGESGAGEESDSSPHQAPSVASSPPNGTSTSNGTLPTDDRSASRAHKKSAPPLPPPPPPKPVPTKSRRVGRNQYTRDALPPSSLANSLDPDDAVVTRTRSRSHSQVPESPPDRNGNGNGNSNSNGSGANGIHTHMGLNGVDGAKPSRPKHMNPNRTSLNEMKKRVAGILEFVTKAQEESGKKGVRRGDSVDSGGGGGGDMVVDEKVPNAKDDEDTNGKVFTSKDNSSSKPNGTSSSSSSSIRPVNGSDATDQEGEPAADKDRDKDRDRDKENPSAASSTPALSVNGGAPPPDTDFSALTAGEMLKVLRARLVTWETEYGRWGTKA